MIWVGLLQGVNIGKNRRIPMSTLREIVSSIGGEQVSTIVNSGNVVFRHSETDEMLMAQNLTLAIEQHLGMLVPVILRAAGELNQIIEANPYAHVSDPKQIHVEFLRSEVPEALHEVSFGHDHLTLHSREVFLYLPNGISGITYDWRTFAHNVSTDHTSRNWNTVCKLAKTAGGLIE